MTKRLIEIDDELLVAAKDASGRETIKGTVTAALQACGRTPTPRADHAGSLARARGALADLQDEDVMRRTA